MLQFGFLLDSKPNTENYIIITLFYYVIYYVLTSEWLTWKRELAMTIWFLVKRSRSQIIQVPSSDAVAHCCIFFLIWKNKYWVRSSRTAGRDLASVWYLYSSDFALMFFHCFQKRNGWLVFVWKIDTPDTNLTFGTTGYYFSNSKIIFSTKNYGFKIFWVWDSALTNLLQSVITTAVASRWWACGTS